MEDKLTKWKKVLETLSTEFVTPAEVKRIFDALVKVFKEFKSSVSQEMASIKAEMTTFKNGVESKLTNSEKSLSSKIEKFELSQAAKWKEAEKQFRASVNTMTEMINELPDYDPLFFAFSTRLDEVAKTIPPPTDLTALLEQIADLEEEITALKNRPVPTGGGVSDMRIRQAFKYILHTEAPIGAIDGVNTAYTVNHVPFAVVGLVLNGEHIAELPNYTVSGKTITFTSAIPAAYSGKDFEIKYIG